MSSSNVDMVEGELASMDNEVCWCRQLSNECLFAGISDELAEVAQQTNSVLEYLILASIVLLRTRKLIILTYNIHCIVYNLHVQTSPY